MSLRRLRYFVTVAEEMSFTAAARRLHMAQPPLSVQIKELERDFGVTLFRREGRRVSLTAAGHAILPEAERVLARYDALAGMARRAAAGETGRLAVGLIPSAANGELPGVLTRFGHAHPDVEVTLVEDRPPQLLELLAADEVDLVLQYGRPDAADVESTAVASEELLVALPAGHVLAERRRVPITALRATPIILPPRHAGDGLHDRIVRLLAEHEVEPPVVHGRVWLVQTIIGLVAAGLGVALVPSSAESIRPDEVAYRRVSGRQERVTLYAAWRAGEQPPPVAAFLTLWPGVRRAAR